MKRVNRMEKCKVRPEIDVPYVIEVERNQQDSVDAGHSPWRLDPIFVAQVFANLLLSHEGIVGEYEIPYEDIKLLKSNRVEAVASINHKKSIAKLWII